MRRTIQACACLPLLLRRDSAAFGAFNSSRTGDTRCCRPGHAHRALGELSRCCTNNASDAPPLPGPTLSKGTKHTIVAGVCGIAVLGVVFVAIKAGVAGQNALQGQVPDTSQLSEVEEALEEPAPALSPKFLPPVANNPVPAPEPASPAPPVVNMELDPSIPDPAKIAPGLPPENPPKKAFSRTDPSTWEAEAASQVTEPVETIVSISDPFPNWGLPAPHGLGPKTTLCRIWDSPPP